MLTSMEENDDNKMDGDKMEKASYKFGREK